MTGEFPLRNVHAMLRTCSSKFRALPALPVPSFKLQALKSNAKYHAGFLPRMNPRRLGHLFMIFYALSLSIYLSVLRDIQTGVQTSTMKATTTM